MEDPEGIIQIDSRDWDATPQSIKEIILKLHHLVNNTASHAAQLQSQVSGLQEEVAKYTDPSDFTRLLSSLASLRPKSEKEVVFIVDYPITRQAKLAWALRNRGWRVILLYRDLEWFDWKFYFDGAFRYRTLPEAILLASQFSPKIFHCFSSWDFKTASAIIDHAPGKTIFDNYDYFAGLLKLVHHAAVKDRMPLEKFCVENADAICCRGLTLKVCKEDAGYRPRGKILFFPEYSWNNPSQERLPKRTDGVHAVYVGGLEPQYFRDPERFYSVVDIEFIRMMTEQNIHYHLYPFTLATKENHREHYREYYEESDRNPYFHLHESVPVQELIREISQYHFGVLSTSEKARLEGDWTYEAKNAQGVVFNKLFDYIDADLITVSYGWPTLERIGRGAIAIAERSDVARFIRAHAEDSQFMKSSVHSVRNVRARQSLLNHVHRLERFYNSIA